MFLNSQNIFFVGIKGVAMANLARIASQMGKLVSGSDTNESFITDKIIEDLDINTIYSFEGDKLPDDLDLVIYSAAHGGKNNPQVLEAIDRGVKVLHQAVVLGELISSFNTSIAVAGCHGKTTTTAWLAYALRKLTTQVSYLVGVSEFMNLQGGNYEEGDYFVIEADEYGIDPPEDITPKFELFFPSYAIVTNIDFDHPDIYRDLQDTIKAFTNFISKTVSQESIYPRLVVNGDDPNLKKITSNFGRDSYLTYGFKDNDIMASDISTDKNHTKFVLNSKKFDIKNKDIEISLFGEKNVLNSLSVIGILLGLGFEIDHIQKALKDFSGVKRRFEFVGHKNNIEIYDDYAHHPAEILATLQAARSRFPKKNIIILFQPHTFSRTYELREDFVKAISKADNAFILPVFGSAREQPGKNPFTSEKLEALARERGIENIQICASHDQAIEKITRILKSEDIFITMGAGDVYKVGPKILSDL